MVLWVLLEPNPECIEQLLDSFHLQHIDLISLDVEGHEINILDRFNFTKYQVDVWTVEAFRLNTRIFDRIMHKGLFPADACTKFVVIH